MRPLTFAIATIAALLSVTPEQTEAQVPDRTAPPELGSPPRLDLAPIERFELSNGLPVLLLEKHGVPLVQIDLMMEAGAVLDPPGKAGLASMVGEMLDEGAGDLDALELADTIDFLGAEIGTAAGNHTMFVTLHTPLGKLDQALPIMADIARRPTFPEDELDRKRTERLTTLLQWRDEPRALASVEIGHALFGPDHPYGRPTIGDVSSIESLTTDDLRRFHAAHFHPTNAALIVAGAVDRASIGPRLEAVFGEWEPVDGAEIVIPEAEQVADSRVVIVDKPGAAQSEIRIGRIGVSRKTSDYEAIVVMNTILGGSFASRLNQNLREDKGYSYGAFSRFDFRPTPGPFIAQAAVQTAVTDKALVEFMRELAGILEPVPEPELERARNYVALGLLDNFETVARTTGMIDDLVLYDLPLDYYNDLVDRILGVTGEDVTRVANERLDPGRVVIVVVGDRLEIEEGIRSLDLGPVEVLTIEDVLGPAPELASR